MTKICVAIASHIQYDSQTAFLKKCLQSLIDQTKKVEIIVSISFDNTRYKKKFMRRVFKKYKKNVTFKFTKERKYQMEHIYNLLENFDKYDLIMFCDDDDTYHPQRVECFMNGYEKGKSDQEEKDINLVGCREYVGKRDDSAPEFWQYGLRPDIIHLFFDRIGDDIDVLKHNFSDMYFRYFLRMLNEKHLWCCIELNRPMYNYNKNNSYSICGKIDLESKSNIGYNIEEIKNNLLLLTIKRQDKKFIKSLKLSEQDIKNIFPERKKIIDVCDRLYDIKVNYK